MRKRRLCALLLLGLALLPFRPALALPVRPPAMPALLARLARLEREAELAADRYDAARLGVLAAGARLVIADARLRRTTAALHRGQAAVDAMAAAAYRQLPNGELPFFDDDPGQEQAIGWLSVVAGYDHRVLNRLAAARIHERTAAQRARRALSRCREAMHRVEATADRIEADASALERVLTALRKQAASARRAALRAERRARVAARRRAARRAARAAAARARSFHAEGVAVERAARLFRASRAGPLPPGHERTGRDRAGRPRGHGGDSRPTVGGPGHGVAHRPPTARATRPLTRHQPASVRSAGHNAAPRSRRPVAHRQSPPGPDPAAVAVAWAYRELGKPYVWGGAGPDVFDCSGLTQFAWAKAGVQLLHYTGDQWLEGSHVAANDLRPGDLVFFYPGAEHVAIYVGGGEMIEAPHAGAFVRLVPVDWVDYVGAVRPG